MTQNELIRQVADARGITQTEAGKTVAAVIEAIAEALLAEGDFRLKGLGTLKIAQRKARNGVNPRTGKKMKIKAMRTVRFSPSKALRGRING